MKQNALPIKSVVNSNDSASFTLKIADYQETL